MQISKIRRFVSAHPLICKWFATSAGDTAYLRSFELSPQPDIKSHLRQRVIPSPLGILIASSLFTRFRHFYPCDGIFYPQRHYCCEHHLTQLLLIRCPPVGVCLARG